MKKLALFLILAAATAAKENVPPAEPIDFDRIERTIGKLPDLEDPSYGLFLFGPNGEKKVWAVFDRKKGAEAPHVLYLDRNADGDLTQENEQFRAARGGGKFRIGRLEDPATGAVHTDVSIDYSSRLGVRYRMKWRGGKVTMGTYGPRGDTYQGFAKTTEDAPIFVPGWDRPFQFQHWMSGTLYRNRPTDFKVFIGNRGDRTGAFSAVDDKFLPRGEYVLATLIYPATDGTERRHQVKLTERC